MTTDMGSYSLADIGAMMNNKGDGFLEGNGIIILILFFLIFGFGGNGWGNSASAQTITNDFLYTNLSNQIGRSDDRIESAMNTGFNAVTAQGYSIDRDILSQTNTINQTLCSGFNGVNANIATLASQMATQCCDLKTAMHAEGEATRALITENETARLRTDLQSAQLTLSNANQTQNILNALGSYTPYGVTNCGCGSY